MIPSVPRKVSVMGILNVTPDSFSDGGRHNAVRDAVLRARQMADEGADIIDIGGESTRPGAEPVDTEEEERRVLPVLRALNEEGFVLPISVDTRHASVAERCLELGASMINDVSAMESDPRMAAVVRDFGVRCVLMHGYSQELTGAQGVAEEVAGYLASRMAYAEARGIEPSRMIVDPGFGFNKDVAQNLSLLSHLDAVTALGVPILVGLSRKRFVGAITGEPLPEKRVAGSVAGAMLAVMQGAEIIRVHDVGATKAALSVVRAAMDGNADHEVQNRAH